MGSKTPAASAWLIVRGLALVGLADATYLTVEHFLGTIPPCTVGGCELVLTSEYATLGPIPIALLGAFYYLAVFLVTLPSARLTVQMRRRGLWLLVGLGSLTTLGLFYIQAVILNAYCLYCLLSAGITLSLVAVTLASPLRPLRHGD
ncbi:vitamin K epoxide reductase family protein [Candidatus Berkelbacteria bacterium]|nr:vitamin K epoxide reductase family protein [Candidatus Berkelbacteria bacterium]